MKKIIVILLSLFLVLGLAACAGDAPAPPPEAPAPDAPAPEPLPPPPVQDVDADGIEPGASLVFWSMWSEAEPQAFTLTAAANAFTEQTGVTVSINFNGRQGQREGVGPALAAGETIDLFDEDIDRVTSQWGEYLLVLDDFMNGVFSDTHGQPYKSLVNQTLVNMAFEKGGNKFTVVPYQPFIYTTQYNKDLFADAGITSVPTNWEEFLDASQKLLDNGTIPMTVDNAYIPAKIGYTLTRVVGVERTLEIFANFELDDPGVLRTAQIWEDYIKRGFMSPRAATNVYPEGQAGEFAMDTVAMVICGTWLPVELREINPDINWGQFAWPAIDPGGAGIEAHNIGSQCFGINKNTAYPNAAFAFLRWITLGYWDQILANETMGVPMANDATWPPELADAKQIFYDTTNPFPWAAGAEDNPNVSAAIIDGFQRMVAGTMTAQEYADSLAAISG